MREGNENSKNVEYVKERWSRVRRENNRNRCNNQFQNPQGIVIGKAGSMEGRKKKIKEKQILEKLMNH